MQPIKVVFKMGALCCEAVFKPCFDSKILELREDGSLTLDTPSPGNTAFMNHARDVVWLGF
jgi:hypothetical protein